MASFRVVPVLDVKHGVAVHGVKGQREKYAPVDCSWCKDGDVRQLINGYQNEFGLQDLYAADLDAITEGTPSVEVYLQIKELVLGRIMIDAGITNMQGFHDLETYDFAEIILGTESVPSLSVFTDVINTNRNDTIISFDVKMGHLLSPIKNLASAGLDNAFRRVEALNPSAIIYLDLTGVGAKIGVNPVARKLVDAASVPVFLGGGVKSANDLQEAKDAGFCGVLVATALQEGLIDRAGIDALDQ
ncbi:MAG TPA: HisA/HisF-related TIM barrel protein [Candidatus Lokiarchaeia archaeon]|nr:HisA/HisF-related TIM barrel protein [Candidatus Lokiarchaeia archaeon]